MEHCSSFCSPPPSQYLARYQDDVQIDARQIARAKKSPTSTHIQPNTAPRDHNSPNLGTDLRFCHFVSQIIDALNSTDDDRLAVVRTRTSDELPPSSCFQIKIPYNGNNLPALCPKHSYPTNERPWNPNPSNAAGGCYVIQTPTDTQTHRTHLPMPMSCKYPGAKRPVNAQTTDMSNDSGTNLDMVKCPSKIPADEAKYQNAAHMHKENLSGRQTSTMEPNQARPRSGNVSHTNRIVKPWICY